MRRPLNTPINITQEFGDNGVNYAQFGMIGHNGVDYEAKVGRAVYAPENATVIKSANGTTDQYTGRAVSGETIVLKGTYEHWLMHLSKRSVSVGQTVKEGDLIGYTGNTGYTTGPHLHWGVRPLSPDINNGYRGFIDPWDILQAPAPAKLEGWQRKVGVNGVNERIAANTTASVHKEWPAGEILDFKGYVKGEKYGDTDIWFVGKYNGRYFWAGAFTDSGTHDLTDLTPASPVPVPLPTPSPAPVVDLSAKVIDISSHNEVVDYELASKSVRAVIAKAGHTGKSYSGIQPYNGDPMFARYKEKFGEKLVGAYWYGYASLDPEAEAMSFVHAVGTVPSTFSYWLDIEEFDGKTKEEVNTWCAKFLFFVEVRIGRKCGLYMNRNWFDNYITEEVKAERPIWLAHYNVDEWHAPVKNQVAHQYTSQGKVPGFAANDLVDINVVNSQFFIPRISPQPTPVDPAPTPPISPQDPDEPVVVAPTPDPSTPNYVTEIKTVAVNMVVTFFQTFAATWAATGFQLDKVVIAGAIGGALSLVWNTILKPFLIKKGLLKQ